MKITEFTTKPRARVLKETRTPNQILMELNVINIPQIDTFLQGIAQNLPTKDTQKWFISRSKKYLINSEEDNAVITHFSGKAEPWMKQRQKEGVKLYRFNPSHDLTTKLAHVVDWVRAMNDTVTGDKASDQQSIARAKKAIKGLGNTSIAQAIELSDQWVIDMNSANASKEMSSYKRPEDEKGLVPVMVHGEFKWYQLTDQDCLDREGKVMGHCVSSYGSDVASGKTMIYSLRDANNFAHATVEVKRGKLEQVKGKRNQPPVAKYQRATVALLNTLSVTPNPNGLRDIQGMNFLYNAKNRKYGTIRDIGEKIYSGDGGVEVWSIGGSNEESNSFRIISGDKVICNIGERRYGGGFEYVPVDEDAMSNITVKDAKYSDPTYKLAKLITQAMPQVIWQDSNVDLHSLSKYMVITKEKGLLTMYEDLGDFVYGDDNSNDVIRFVAPGQVDVHTKNDYVHLQDGRLISTFMFNPKEKDIGGRKTVTGSSWHGIEEESEGIISLYVNAMKQKDRPIVQSKGVYQNPKTFEASTDIEETSEEIFVSKSKNIGWYRIVNASDGANSDSRRNRRRRGFDVSDLEPEKPNQLQYRYILVNKAGYVSGGTNKNAVPICTIDVPEDESTANFQIVHRDSLSNLSSDEIKEVADVFNNSGLNKYYPFTENRVVTDFENVGLYFLREKRMFTNDHSIAGEQFKHEDKDFNAIKTHNHLKIYYKGSEVVVFDLDSESSKAGIKNFHLKNRLTMLSNCRKIADVLNHYEIYRKDQGDYNINANANRKMSQAGLTFSHDNGWKGMKSGPKPVEDEDGSTSKKIGKNEYEIHSFKRDFLVQNSKTQELVATFKGYKEAGNPLLYVSEIKMENQREASWDIVADALNELNGKPDVRVRLSSSNAYRDEMERQSFNEKLRSRGYVGLNGGDWDTIAAQYPTEVISKGPGGTWVKEVHATDIDFAIQEILIDARNDRYNDNQSLTQKSVNKYQQYNIGLGDEKYTLYSRKTPVLRAFVQRGNLQIIYRVNGKITPQVLNTKEDVLKYANPIGRLLSNIKMGGGKFLSDKDLYVARGKIDDITKNPKLIGYNTGEIVYEDGHRWKRGDGYRKDEWHLSLSKDGKTYRLITVEIGDGGLEKISFDEEKVKKYTKLYRPFLNDIMDIVDQLYGNE